MWAQHAKNANKMVFMQSITIAIFTFTFINGQKVSIGHACHVEDGNYQWYLVDI